jgi:hypothetical protein
MPEIFKQTQVSSMEDTKPVRLTVEGLSNERLWITQINGQSVPNFQIMNAIGPEIYVNVFNHRLAPFNLAGIYVTADCDGEVEQDGEPPFLTFYKQNNIVQRTESIRITFNGIVIQGYMVRLSIGNYSQEGIDGHTFKLEFLGTIDGLQKATNEDATALGARFQGQSAKQLRLEAISRLSADPTSILNSAARVVSGNRDNPNTFVVPPEVLGLGGPAGLNFANTGFVGLSGVAP